MTTIFQKPSAKPVSVRSFHDKLKGDERAEMVVSRTFRDPTWSAISTTLGLLSVLNASTISNVAADFTWDRSVTTIRSSLPKGTMNVGYCRMWDDIVIHGIVLHSSHRVAIHQSSGYLTIPDAIDCATFDCRKQQVTRSPHQSSILRFRHATSGKFPWERVTIDALRNESHYRQVARHGSWTNGGNLLTANIDNYHHFSSSASISATFHALSARPVSV